MKSFPVLLVFAVISLFVTSCATFPKNGLPRVAGNQASGGRKVTMTYSLTSGHNLTGTRVEGVESQKGLYGKSLVAAAEKSGRFSSVREGKGGGVHVDVDMLNHANGGAAFVSGFISGLTFTAIPAFAADNYTLTATARSSSGKTRKYVLDDGVNTIIWLPMIFAMPTNHPESVVPEVHENMFRNLIVRMEQDGLVP